MKSKSWLIVIALIISIFMACDKPSDNKAPTISFSAPANNSSFMPGESLTLSVEVDDPEEDLKEVRFYANNIGLASVPSWPYSFDWETGSVELGEYTIKAEAIDNDGAKGDAEIAITIGRLEAPTHIAFLILSDTEIQISWQDNTSFETGFKIERDAGSGFIELGTVSANVTSYTDSDLIYRQSYTYRVAAFTTTSTSGYSTEAIASSIAPMVDYDGNVYQTVQIGNQIWMAENLKVTHYRDGTAITNVTDNDAWGELTTEAYSIYNNNASTEATYGALYNWYSATDSRSIAPEGWHVPTDAEWQVLIDYLGGDAIAGAKMKETGTTHWASPNEGATNESGFTALAGGIRHFSRGDHYSRGYYGCFWSASGHDSYSSWYREIQNSSSSIGRHNLSKNFGFSIRLLRD